LHHRTSFNAAAGHAQQWRQRRGGSKGGRQGKWAPHAAADAQHELVDQIAQRLALASDNWPGQRQRGNADSKDDSENGLGIEQQLRPGSRQSASRPGARHRQRSGRDQGLDRHQRQKVGVLLHVRK